MDQKNFADLKKKLMRDPQIYQFICSIFETHESSYLLSCRDIYEDVFRLKGDIQDGVEELRDILITISEQLSSVDDNN